MEAIRIVLAAASMLVMMIVIISSASAELTEEEPPPSPISTTTDVAASATLLSSSTFLSVMQFHIGNTPVFGVPDTGSDLIWTNNSQLFDALPKVCPSDDGSITSPSCNGLCIFKRQYASTVPMKGVMGRAKLTFKDDDKAGSSYTTPDLIDIGSALVTGCHHLSSAGGDENEACKPYRRGGIVGLGRGKLSLVSQLGLQSFSYCLPQYNPADASKTTTGYIKFNDTAAVSFEGTTSLEKIQGLKYPASSRYYVGLEKILVGSKSVDVPNGCLNDTTSSPGDGGMVIDSGTAVTHLPKKVFSDVKNHAVALIKTKTGSEELREVDGEPGCYHGKYYPLLPNSGMDSSIVLHFCSEDREKADQMEIPAKYYFFQSAEDEFCLAFKERDDNMSILGAYQQQDMHMLFNITNNTLSFAKRSACGKSQEENHATM